MEETHQSLKNTDINIQELFILLWTEKIKIIFITLIISTFSVIYALSLPNIYKSETVLAPASSSGNNLSSLTSQYAGVASLAGISLPSSGEVDKVAMAVEIMRSLNFFENLVNKHDLFFNLQAINGWDQSNNLLIIDSEIYDEKLKKWISQNPNSIEGKPSMQKAHRDFLLNFSIVVDKKTGFIKISTKHYSPYFAKQLLDLIVNEINNISRDEAIKIAQDSIELLEREIINTQLNDLRVGINNLIQKQIETVVLANASPEYVIKTLSPSYVSENRAEPNRKNILILGFIFGLFLSSFYVLVRHYIYNTTPFKS